MHKMNHLFGQRTRFEWEPDGAGKKSSGQKQSFSKNIGQADSHRKV